MKATTANTTKDAWDIQNKLTGQPHGWIQWKGSTVCMDIHCACGVLSHIDADFAYHVECSKCHRVYMCNGHIELIELKQRPTSCVVLADAHD